MSSHSSNASDMEYENRFESNTELYNYFMNIAILRARKRKNYKKQAGCCIVNTLQNKIVGIGNYTEINKPFLPINLFSWFKSDETLKSSTDYGTILHFFIFFRIYLQKNVLLALI